MLTEEDIQKLIKAQEEVFATKLDFENFKEEIFKEFNELQTSVDKYAEKADAYFQEMLMLSHKVDRHEKWFQIVADKLGIKLPY